MPASNKPLVSALIVSYNVRDLLLDCLQAFFASSDVPVEAVVVDNASSDGSADAVAQRYPQVKLIRQSKNLGYGRANNAGLQECEGRFILLLNPDVTVGPGCVGRLSDFLLVRPDVGAVGPKVMRPDGTLDLAARRGFPTPATAFYRLSGLSHLFNRSARFNRYNMGHLSPDEPHEMDSGTGACLMLRRAAIDRIGFFDPDYFMYGEDLDLCFRLKLGGWKVYYLPSANAIHLKGMSTRQSTRRMLYEFHSAMWTFHHKHYAEDMPAFANGLVWASIWARWAALTARASMTNDPRISP
jgi:GT2 family glycosyltransferase